MWHFSWVPGTPTICPGLAGLWLCLRPLPGSPDWTDGSADKGQKEKAANPALEIMTAAPTSFHFSCRLLVFWVGLVSFVCCPSDTELGRYPGAVSHSKRDCPNRAQSKTGKW
jgi:hypothetical protein